ncbi:NACHT domain-containing protein [Streptomyces sp. NPDC002746]
MPQYNLNALGAAEFERISQALIKKVIGFGSVTFGPGRDGAREATFSGTSQAYPSTSTPWKGKWIFQVKFHDLSLTTPDKARASIVSEIDSELDKIFNKYKYACDNFVMITNVPISAVAETGTIDVTRKLVEDKYRDLKEFAIWGSDEVCRFLDNFPSIRQPYLHLLVTGDLIAQLLNERRAKLDERATTIETYIQTSYTREMHAQLDQAGDVSDEPVRLQDVFFDLYAEVDEERGIAHLHRNQQVRDVLRRHTSPDRAHGPLGAHLGRLMLSEGVNRIVIVGGPGEGKSTVGQYVAQVHRAMLLGRVSEAALSRGEEVDETYIPLTPRIPFRVILKDFGQWIAEKRDAGHQGTGTIDEFVCSHVSSVTSRRVTPDDLHHVLRENPSLLILDGLDEVTDPDLRKILLSRVGEFVDRCEMLGADLQILASTRPTGYAKEFDPAVFLHMRLAKLEPKQVQSYVTRWAKAKSLDESKASRVKQTMAECLQDAQIRLLTNTPLQVTILLLIISSGGTPPRQREALFNEYLDIMYRREMAKGRHIIQSEKELLLGLHKYIGYVLHEKTTRAEAMGSVLPRKDYEKHVSQFLLWHDPYSSSSKRKDELKAITTEAGERLVLIVEPAAGVFGFELRSIQEFFAACHLADTSIDTAQRYKRFEAIARLPHWRNVALFFVGRVGRNYAGEAANIIEVCRAIDREAPDSFVHRGGNLALELAADRAFGPNRRRQHSLLELGIEVFDRHISEDRRQNVQDMLLRLPTEDRKDLAVPLLEKKVALLNSAYLGPLLRTLQRLDPKNRSIFLGFERMAENSDYSEEALSLYFSLRPNIERAAEIAQRLASDLGSTTVGKMLARLGMQTICQACEDLRTAGLPSDFVTQSVLESAKHGAFSWIRSEEREFLNELCHTPWPSEPAGIALRIIATLQKISMRAEAVPRSQSRTNRVSATHLDLIPAHIKSGTIAAPETCTSSPDSQLIVAMEWILHITSGDVTARSAAAAVSFFRTFRLRHSSISRIFGNFSYRNFPTMDLLYTAVERNNLNDWTIAERALLEWGGAAGRVRWHQLSDALVKRLLETPAAERTSMSAVRLHPNVSDTSTDEQHPQTPEVLIPVLGDYIWAIAVTSGNRRYSVDSGIFEQAARHIMQGSSALSPLCDIASQLYGDLPHWFSEGEVHEMRLSMLLALLAEPNSSACLQLIPMAVWACLESGAVPENVFRKACAAVGEREEILRSTGITRIAGRGNSALFARLLEVAYSNNQAEKAGALCMIRDFSYLHAHPIFYRRLATRRAGTSQGTGIRVKGFTEMHRTLAMSKVDIEKDSGIALFSVRPPKTKRDWNILYDVVISCRDQRTANSLRIAIGINGSGRAEQNVDEWIPFIQNCLQNAEYPPMQAILADRLDELLASQDQSLRTYEDVFGLPLPQISS